MLQIMVSSILSSHLDEDRVSSSWVGDEIMMLYEICKVVYSSYLLLLVSLIFELKHYSTHSTLQPTPSLNPTINSKEKYNCHSSNVSSVKVLTLPISAATAIIAL